MAHPVTISIGGKSFKAELYDTAEGRAVLEALPIEENTSTWGDEFYFSAGLNLSGGEGTSDLEVGDLGYWPQGDCLCVFFGRTPMSASDKPVPASDVYVIGRVLDDPAGFIGVINANPIRWDKA